MKKLLLFAFAVFAFAACTQNDVEELSANRADVPETLTVGFEGGDTRIQLNEAQKTVWTKDDIVSVFYRSNANQKWQYQGETGERVGVLKRLDSGVATRDLDNVVVVYPYNENYYINPNSCSVQAMLPATQHYKQNSYGYDGNIMVSCDEYNQISLRNVCGWLKIQLTGNGEKVQSIILRGNNGEQVAGEVYINAYNATSVLASDMGSLPEDDEIGAGGAGGGLQFDDTIFTELTLDCGEGVELGAEAKSFYIAVPPQTFEKGVTVVVECEGYEPMTLTTTSVLTIERNHIKPMESVEHDSVEIPSVLKVVTRMYDGFAVHVDIPEDVKTRGNALRYLTTSLAMYNYMKSIGYMELDMLLYNASQCTTEDTTITYDEQHRINNDVDYADPKVPGEPGVFIIGEFSYMDKTDENIVYHKDTDTIETVYEDMYSGDGTVIWEFPAGWSNGYYRPEFDWISWLNAIGSDGYDTERYWSGYYERIQIDTLEPGLCDGSIEIDVYSMSPKDATIYLTPIDNPTSYSFYIIEEEEFQNEVMPLLDYNYDYLRWFTGSYFALHTFGVKMATGSVAMKLTDWFVDTKGFAGKTFRILVTIMGDAEGKTQNFRTKTFTLPAATKPAPEVIVTALENDDPYLATFNIKAPNKDAYEAYFACNYVREFDNILDSYTYLSLLQDMGNKFGNTEIEMINSDAGFTFSVASRENATTRLAVLAYNNEGTHNNVNATGTSSVCEYTTPRANYPARVNSDLFEALCGEWTASAGMIEYVIDYTTGEGKWINVEDPYTSDVTISNSVYCPESLTEDVYKIYEAAGVSRDETDELFEEFQALAKEYNNRTRGFNRLLCLGYNFASPEYAMNVRMQPWDLFIAEDYGFEVVSNIFYDFGPKWNLEIDKDGSVWLPIDIKKEFPLEVFKYGTDYSLYMLAVGMNSYLGGPYYKNGELVLDARFPVEVSEDRNTITIKPIVYNYTDSNGNAAVETYYPCVAQLQYGQATPLNPRVGSDVVLTRKTSATAAKSNASVAASKGAAVNAKGSVVAPVARATKAMTSMDASKIVVREQIVKEHKMETGSEAFHKRAKAMVKDLYGIEIE